VNEEGYMHARVSVFQMTPDEVDAGLEYGRGTISQMTEMEGFRGNLALVDREAGRITSITLWESEEAMKASEARANAMRSSAASAVDAGVVSVDRYEVGYFIQP
jgi:heme-degrading monooxygenase HmoA